MENQPGEKKKKKKKKDAIIKRWCKDHHGESTTPRHLQKHSPFSFFFLFQETVARIIGRKPCKIWPRKTPFSKQNLWVPEGARIIKHERELSTWYLSAMAWPSSLHQVDEAKQELCRSQPHGAYFAGYVHALRSSDIAAGMQWVVRISSVAALAVFVSRTTICTK